jgi:CTP synthase
VLPPSASTDAPEPDLTRWQEIVERIRNPEGEVTIAIVGKYTGLKDAYKSLIEALVHGGIANKVKVKLDWIESEIFEKEDPAPYLEGCTASWCPAASASAARRARSGGPLRRERKVPYFGICFGMQMAVIEAARNLPASKGQSTEFGPTPEPVVGLMTEWMKGNELEKRAPAATSAAPCGSAPIRRTARRAAASPRSTAATEISERHRHRYEVNIAYKRPAGGRGPALLRHVARRPAAGDRRAPDHPWFIGVQYHPELKSRPFEPHPLFALPLSST